MSKKEELDSNRTHDDLSGLDPILTILVLWLTDHILRDDSRMCLIFSMLQRGINIDQAEELADSELHEAKERISKVMLAMINVSNTSFRELRSEISRRKKLEVELKKEIFIRKQAEERLKHLAHHDSLTDLPNRILFEELCEAALRTAKRDKSTHAVMFVDIDGFKGVNDTMGHKAGDELLISIAQRLKEQVRDSDFVARLGGDEFVIHVGGNINEDDMRMVASKILKAISQPFQLDDGTAHVGASIGIAIFPKDADSSKALIKNADAAMYVAKKGGKNAFKYFCEI